MRESAVEKHLVKRAAEVGGIALKFVSPGRRNVPDRLVLLPEGRSMFVELKAPGLSATAGQCREHDRLRALGQDVFVCDSHAAIDALLERE